MTLSQSAPLSLSSYRINNSYFLPPEFCFSADSFHLGEGDIVHWNEVDYHRPRVFFKSIEKSWFKWWNCSRWDWIERGNVEVEMSMIMNDELWSGGHAGWNVEMIRSSLMRARDLLKFLHWINEDHRIIDRRFGHDVPFRLSTICNSFHWIESNQF